MVKKVSLERMHPLAEYIIRNYADAEKIVEVGVGKYTEVIDALRKALLCEVVGVDIAGGSGIVRDDVFSPSFDIYRGATLIYSIRPEPELVPQLKKLARAVGSDLIVRPLATDFVDSEFRLVNYKGEFFYVLRG